MTLYKLVLQFLFVAIVCGDFDRKQHFCGKKLSDTLNELCLIHNSPKFEISRYRRHIVDECCKLPCTKRYLIEFYCYKPRSSVRRLLLKSKESNHNFETKMRETDKKPHNNCNNKCRKCKTEKVAEKKHVRRVPLQKNNRAANIGYIEHFQQPIFVNFL